MLTPKHPLLLAFLPAVALCVFWGTNFVFEESIIRPTVLQREPIGTPSREEREYKLGFEKSKDIDSVISKVGGVVRFCSEEIHLPTKQSSRIEFSTGAQFYRDIYFDSTDFALLKSNISYRMRHRFPSKAAYDQFQRGSRRKEVLPSRFEIQAKKRLLQKDESSLVTVFEEGRLEFPLGQFERPGVEVPASPWPIEKFMKVAKTGYFLGGRITPAMILDKHLGGRLFLKIHPQVAIFTRRYRWHVSSQTGLGSGNNPDQVLLVSLDLPEFIFLGGSLQYLRPQSSVTTRAIDPEIEIELERNISVSLDREENVSLKESFRYYHQSFQNCLKTGLKMYYPTIRSQKINKYSRALGVKSEG